MDNRRAYDNGQNNVRLQRNRPLSLIFRQTAAQGLFAGIFAYFFPDEEIPSLALKEETLSAAAAAMEE